MAKRNSTGWYLFVALICLIITPSLYAEVKVFIEQPQYILNHEQEFTISVKVEGLVEPLRAYELALAFDTNYFSVTGISAFQEGNFLSNNGLTQWYVIGEDGSYRITCAILGVTPGSAGSGTLFNLTMSSQTASTGLNGTDINLSDIIMRDALNNAISVSLVENCNVVIVTQTFQIPLSTGWNLVSSPVIPYNPDLETVFSRLVSDGYLLKVQDEMGNALVRDTQGEWVNSLVDYQADEGYFVKVNADCVLSINGDYLVLPMSIQLQTGWNIISYPYLTPQNAMSFLQPLIDANQLVRVQDERESAIFKNSYGVWINNIGNFAAGEGYYIKVNADTQINYPTP
jgi:hypothetical protein